jgi:hypothetical protein
MAAEEYGNENSDAFLLCTENLKQLTEQIENMIPTLPTEMEVA